MSIRTLLYVLEDKWTADVTGRDQSVPAPMFVQSNEMKRIGLEEQDAIIAKDGGTTDYDPQGLGWPAERREDMVTLDVRTLDVHGGRDRLFGVRDRSTYEAEDYGGLVGEVKRILDLHRKGLAEYCIVEGYEINDLSEDQGFGRYRAEVEVRLTAGPYPIDPPASN